MNGAKQHRRNYFRLHSPPLRLLPSLPFPTARRTVGIFKLPFFVVTKHPLSKDRHVRLKKPSPTHTRACPETRRKKICLQVADDLLVAIFFFDCGSDGRQKKREKKYFGSDNKARWFQCHSKDIDGNKPAFYRHSSNNRHAAISQRVPRTAYVTVGMFNSTDLSRSKSSQVFHSSSGREADKSPRSSCEKKKPAWNMIRCLTQDPLDVSDSKEGRDVSHSFTKSVYWAELSFFSSGDLEKEPANPPARVFSRHHISLQLTGRVVLSSSCIFTCGHFEKENYSVLLCVFYPYFLVGEHLRSNR